MRSERDQGKGSLSQGVRRRRRPAAWGSRRLSKCVCAHARTEPGRQTRGLGCMCYSGDSLRFLPAPPPESLQGSSHIHSRIHTFRVGSDPSVRTVARRACSRIADCRPRFATGPSLYIDTGVDGVELDCPVTQTRRQYPPPATLASLREAVGFALFAFFRIRSSSPQGCCDERACETPFESLVPPVSPYRTRIEKRN